MNTQELKIQQELEEKGLAEFTAGSGAMRPLIRPGRDVCIIRPLPHRHLRKGEVILYRRQGGVLTLGRITRVHRRVSRIRVCGDNRTHEARGISRADILGLLCGVRRDGEKCISTSDILYKLYSLVMRIRTAIVLAYMNGIQKPVLKFCKKILSLFGRDRYEYPVHKGSHHHHSSGADYRVSRGVWYDLIHALNDILPASAKKMKFRPGKSRRLRSWKSKLMFWKKKEHHHHHHQHTSYDELLKRDHGILQIRHAQYFLFGFRVPWVPKFLLDKYGLKKIKSVNNNMVTMMDWTIHADEFKMPYNMSMQTLSMGVFIILVAKLSLAVWWLVYFMIYGNESSSRIYMYNLLVTATWFPIALFFLAYFFHLNKILYMSIQRVTLLAAVVCLLRVSIFVVKLVHSDTVLLSPNLVTLFNSMEIICWICLSGFFFIMHYKLSGRKDFIPHFWESKAQTEERLRKRALKNLIKHQRREQQIAHENREQHAHVEH